MSLFASLLIRARLTPTATFCYFVYSDGVKHYSVGEIVDDARRIAGRLRERGVRPGQVVPIVLSHRIELYTAFIGCVLAGSVPTLLPPLTRKQDPETYRLSMARLLHRVGPPCILGSSATLMGLTALGFPVIDLYVPAGTSGDSGDDCQEINPDDLVLLQHSSGTTGLKKAVCLSHRTVLAQIAHYSAAIGLTPNDIIASWLPLYHDMGLITSFLMPAIAGVPIVSIDALEWVVRPTMLLDAVQKFGATLCWLPNFAFHHIARLARPDDHWNLSSLRMLVNCSEPCRAAAFDAFESRFASCGVRRNMLHACYAMAENVFAVTQTGSERRSQPVPEAAAGYVSSGHPIEATSLRIVRGDGSAAADGEPGEILVATDCLFSGYFRTPDLTAERLREGWYYTGDIGLLAAGELYVVGRADDVLNINGKKLIAHEVEDALNDVVGVAPGRVLVYAEYDHATGAAQLLVAAERSDIRGAPDAVIQAAIRRQVMAECGLRPSDVTLLDRGALLKSSSGKLARRASIDRLACSRQPRGAV